MSRQDRVFIRSHDGFRYSIGQSWARNDVIEDLFLLHDPVCVDPESLDEVRPDPASRMFHLDPSKVYVVFPAAVVDSEADEPEEYRPGATITPQRMQVMSGAVLGLVKKYYKPLYPEIFEFNESFLAPSFLEAFQKPGDLLKNLKLRQESEITKVYSFELLNTDFTNKLIGEVQNFENFGLPVNRPNSMNNYGAILHNLGFTPLIDHIVLNYLAPISKLLYPEFEVAQNIDSHHSFIVQYKLTEDLDLGFHYDDSHITLNVCLGKTFEGGELYFKGLYDFPETHNENLLLGHTPGRAFIHLGQHRHGAQRILSGERYNLIIWGRTSALFHHHYHSH